MEKLHTVDDIAKMTYLTSRTIRNYLKDGILKGRKIGGQWRFTEGDIKRFMDNGSYLEDNVKKQRQDILDFVDGVNDFADEIGEIQVCAIIDVYMDEEAVKGKLEALMEYINTADNKVGKYMNFTCNRIESESKHRFVLYARPIYLIEALKVLQG
jgi:excisionase family DNA binding protein